MNGVGAARTRDSYLALLRPWFGFLANHCYPWNARPDAVRECIRLFLLEAGCALRTSRVEGWFVQATNRSPISANGLHLFIAALRSRSIANGYVMLEHRSVLASVQHHVLSPLASLSVSSR
jgi:hypothetical protein